MEGRRCTNQGRRYGSIHDTSTGVPLLQSKRSAGQKMTGGEGGKTGEEGQHPSTQLPRAVKKDGSQNLYGKNDVQSMP